MGGAVSTGVDNDDLIDNLCEESYIRTPMVERVFRAVDRGEYILPDARMNAYKDQAWRNNHLHLSAPCIYSEVMEGLCLGPGLSFLNLGAGTGYLSTMVGLILGSNGINHGVEYYDDVIVYANKKLEDFKKYSGAIDEFDFCEPKFMQGNCLCLTSDRQYDRVYVGATCPESCDIYMKNLLRVGGILVMPMNEQLWQIKRTSLSTWETTSVLSVSFAKLIMPKGESKDNVELLDIEPQSLQSMCRSIIRNILRNNIDVTSPELKDRKLLERNPSKRKTKEPTMINNDLEDIFNPRESRNPQQPTVICRRSSRDYFSSCVLNEEYETDISSDDEAKVDSITASQIAALINLHQPPQAAEEDKIEKMDTSTSQATEPTTSGSASESKEPAKQARQKFDSGLGDESQSDDVMSCHGDDNENDCDNGSKGAYTSLFCDNVQVWHEQTGSWRRTSCVVYGNNCSTCTSDSDEEEAEEVPVVETDDHRVVKSPYSSLMCDKIQELPLPTILKDYLNFYRI